MVQLIEQNRCMYLEGMDKVLLGDVPLYDLTQPLLEGREVLCPELYSCSLFVAAKSDKQVPAF